MKNRVKRLILVVLALLMLVGCVPAITFYGTDYEGVKNKGFIVTLKDEIANVFGSNTITVPGNYSLEGVKIEDILKFSAYDYYNKHEDLTVNWGDINSEGDGNSGYFSDVLETVASVASKLDSFTYAGHIESAFPIGQTTFIDALSVDVEAFNNNSFSDVAKSAEVVFNILDFGIDDLDFSSENCKIKQNSKVSINFFFFDESNFDYYQYKDDINTAGNVSVLPGDLADKYKLFQLGTMYIDLTDFSKSSLAFGTSQNVYYDLLQMKMVDYNADDIEAYNSDSFPYYLNLSNFFSGTDLVGDIGLIPYDTGLNLREGLFFITIKYDYEVNYYDKGGSPFSGSLVNDGTNPSVVTYSTLNSSAKILVSATKKQDLSEDSDFFGWYDNINCTGLPVTEIDKFGGNYYAKWRNPDKPYTVKYVNRDASGNITDLLQYDTDLSSGDMPSWKGTSVPSKKSTNTIDYVFDKWDRDFVACSGEEYDVVYTATYTEQPRKYSVHFDTYGYGLGDISNPSGSPTLKEGDSYFSEYACGTAVTLPVLEWNGYDFLGWYDRWYDDYGVYYSQDPYTEIPSNSYYNFDFVAKWNKVRYTAEFRDIEDQLLSQRYYDIETYDYLPTFSKDGYTFLGYKIGNALKPSKNVSFYGNYGNKVFTAYFEAKITDGKNSTYTKYVDSDATITFGPSSDQLKKVLVDGTELNANNYTIDSTNKKIIFKDSYLNSLSAKKYKVTLKFSKGDAECSITVKEPTYYVVDIPNSVTVNSNGNGSITLNCSELLTGFKLKVKVESTNDFKLLNENNRSSYIAYSLSKNIDQNKVIYTFDNSGSVNIDINITNTSHAKTAGDYVDNIKFDVELVYPEQ